MTADNRGRPDPLAKLTNLNPMVVVLTTVALFLGVLLLPDLLGAALIVVIVAGLGWLLTRTWVVLTPTARGLRLVVIALLLAVAASKIIA